MTTPNKWPKLLFWFSSVPIVRLGGRGGGVKEVRDGWPKRSPLEGSSREKNKDRKGMKSLPALPIILKSSPIISCARWLIDFDNSPRVAPSKFLWGPNQNSKRFGQALLPFPYFFPRGGASSQENRKVGRVCRFEIKSVIGRLANDLHSDDIT